MDFDGVSSAPLFFVYFFCSFQIDSNEVCDITQIMPFEIVN